MKYDNIVIGVSNYATLQLGKTLRAYGKLGYKECVERVKNCLENRNQSSEPVFIQMSLF